MARGKGEGTITKLKNGTYCGRITVGYDENGKQKRKAFYAKTRREVQERMDAAKVELQKGTYIELSNITLSEWVDVWLEEYKRRTVKPSTYSKMHQYFNRYIKPAFGKYKLRDLREEMVQKFINDLTDKGLSTSTITHNHSYLYGALKQAVKNELLVKNVADGINLPQKVKKENRVLTQEEQARFVEVARETLTGRAFILALYTGLRIGELLALTWDDVDFDNGILSVNKTLVEYREPKPDGSGYIVRRMVGSPKTASSKRDIPVLASVLNMLKEEKENAVPNSYNLIYASAEGGYIATATARTRFIAILMKANIANIKQLHIHSLRHTFATLGLENGIELKVMQELLGHATISMTADMYTHVLPDKKKSAIEKLNESIVI